MPTLSPNNLGPYLQSLLWKPVEILSLTPLFKPSQPSKTSDPKQYGYGQPLKVHYRVAGQDAFAVFETIKPSPFGHEEMPDRAADILRTHRTYNTLPRHVRSIDVGALCSDGRLKSLGDAEECFTLVEFAQGREYAQDFVGPVLPDASPQSLALARADALCDYLVQIHSQHGTKPELYTRRIRELLGHGECLMGIIDSYPPDGPATPDFLQWIEHQCLAWRWRVKHRTHRLRAVHGDFHPWNILFRDGADFSILDRSRGDWGEPADDVTCITLNYLFFSLQKFGRLDGPFKTLFDRFWQRYLNQTNDYEILQVAAPFLAWRALVMASPLWYPSLDQSVRQTLFTFVRNVLEAPSFDPQRANDYCIGPALPDTPPQTPTPSETPPPKSTPAFALWITGLPASGKSTVTKALLSALQSHGLHPAVLESDMLRHTLTPQPTYSQEERDAFYASIAFIAKLLTEHGVPTLIDATANLRRYRDHARQQIPHFIEVFVDTPLQECIARDPKGIYSASANDPNSNVPGQSAPFEPPLSPELIIQGAHESPDLAAQRIINTLIDRHFLGK